MSEEWLEVEGQAVGVIVKAGEDGFCISFFFFLLLSCVILSVLAVRKHQKRKWKGGGGRNKLV